MIWYVMMINHHAVILEFHTDTGNNNLDQFMFILMMLIKDIIRFKSFWMRHKSINLKFSCRHISWKWNGKKRKLEKQIQCVAHRLDTLVMSPMNHNIYINIILPVEDCRHWRCKYMYNMAPIYCIQVLILCVVVKFSRCLVLHSNIFIKINTIKYMYK